MADLLQGDVLPSTTTTAQTQATAPQFYTDYLQNIANLGTNAVQQGGVAGFSPLQLQALQMAPQTAFAGSGTLGQASNTLANVSGQNSGNMVGNYLSPYSQDVSDEMARLSNQNVQENVMPTLNAGAVGSGQFGSSRQADVTGQTLRDIQTNLQGQQAGLLNTEFGNALTAANNDLSRQTQIGQAQTQLGQTQQTVGSGGLNTMFNLGQNEQNLGQTALNYPMVQAQNYAKLLPTTIPMGTTTQTVAPGQAGQFGLSGLQQVGTLASILQAIQSGNMPNLSQASNTASLPQATVPPAKKRGGSIHMARGGIPHHAEYHDGRGNYYDKDGYLVG